MSSGFLQTFYPSGPTFRRTLLSENILGKKISITKSHMQGPASSELLFLFPLGRHAAAPTSLPSQNATAPTHHTMALAACSSMHSEPAHALQACAALDADDPLQVLTRTLLDTVECRLQQRDIGLRPALPDRHKYLNKLAACNPRRPKRAAAFAAIDCLLAAVWVPMTVAQRKQRCADKRKHDAISTLPDLSPSSLHDNGYPWPESDIWSESVPQLCFEPDPDADTPNMTPKGSEGWWRRLEHMGLSPGNTHIYRAESNSLAAIGRERRHSV